MKELITFLLFTLLTFHCLFAKEKKYFFDNYTLEKGLIHNHVLTLFKDSRNLLWVGGYGGVQYFDGHDFHDFNIVGKEKINKLSHTTIQVIFEDHDKNLWFGTESGLNKYNVTTGAIKIFQKTHYPNLKSDNIRAIVQDKKGVFWIGTYGGGLIEFDEKNASFIPHDISFQNNKKEEKLLINTLLLKDKRLWIGTEENGVAVFDIETKKVDPDLLNKFQVVAGETINTFFFDQKKDLWIGTWGNGIFQFDQHAEFKKHYINNSDIKTSLNGNIVKVIAQKNKNELWIGTYGHGLSILHLNKNTFEKVREQKDESQLDYIWAGLFDDNNCWFGTFGYGIMKLNFLKNTFNYQLILEEKDIGIDQITSTKNDIIIRSEEYGLYTLDQDQNILSFTFLDKKNITSFYIDKANNTWVAYGGNVKCYNQYHQLIYSFEPTANNFLHKGKISTIFEDQQSNLWFAYEQQNILCLSKNELNKHGNQATFKRLNTIFKHNPLPIQDNISLFLIEEDNLLWIGTPTQLLEIDLYTKDYKTHTIPLPTSIIKDENGNTWVGTKNDGLYYIDYRENTLKKLQYNEGLECIDIQSLQMDNRKRLWIATSCGFSIIDTQSEKVFNLDNNYGLRKFSFNDNVSLKMADGTFVFGGNHGLLKFNPNLIGQNLISTPTFITDVRKDNISIAYENSKDTLYNIEGLLFEMDTITISSDHHILTFKFASISYENATNAHYAYQLEGYDPKWIQTTSDERTATFTKLPVGKYKLNLKSSYHKGYWSSDIKSYVILVEGKFYEMFWFKLLVIAFIFISIAGIIRFYFKKLKLEGQYDEKNKEIFMLIEQKKEVDLKNNSLLKELHLNHQQLHELKIKYKLMKEHMSSMYQNISEYINTSPITQNDPLKTVKDNLQTIQNDPLFEQILELDTDNFIIEFAKEYPKLTATDLRICKLIRQNKTNKEIAQILNITNSSLEQSRYRMRKKMALNKTTNLNDLIIRF